MVLAGCAGAVAMMVLNRTESDAVGGMCVRTGFAVFFAFPMLVAAGFAGELLPRWRGVSWVVGLTAVWAHWWWLEPDRDGVTMLLVWIAAAALASAVPGMVRGAGGNWWRVNIGGLNALILAGILTGVVSVGLLLATESVRALFDVRLPRLAGDVMAVCGFVVAPMAVTALLPAARGELDAGQPGFAVWERFCQWALVPIGVLFTCILAAYAARIAVERELPDGMVALPVLALGCLGLGAVWMMGPWRDRRVWAGVFTRVFPVVFPLFGVLLFIALQRRIEDYGFTFQRYAALGLAVWIVACCLVLLIRRGAPAAFAPALLSVMALVAAFGPLSAREVCLRSQIGHLEGLLADRTEPDNAVRIGSSLRYLAREHGRIAVEEITGPLDLGADASPREVRRAALAKLGVPEIDGDGAVRTIFEWPEERAIPVRGYGLIHGPRWSSIELGRGPGEGAEELAIALKGGGLVALADGGKAHVFDLASIDVEEALGAGQPPGFEWRRGDREFLVVILRAEWAGNAAPDGLSAVEMMVLER